MKHENIFNFASFLDTFYEGSWNALPWKTANRLSCIALHGRHNGPDGVSRHQPHHCLLNRLFRRRSKKTSNSASLAFVRGIHRWPVNSQHKWPVTRKMFPFDDVIMVYTMAVGDMAKEPRHHQFNDALVIVECSVDGTKWHPYCLVLNGAVWSAKTT